MTLLELSTHTGLPAVAGVVRPERFKKEVPLVVMATLLPLPGVKIEGPLAVKV